MIANNDQASDLTRNDRAMTGEEETAKNNGYQVILKNERVDALPWKYRHLI
jgi:hypothetical protein